MGDPTWRGRFADAIATQLGRWDVAEMRSWIEIWSAQIADAVAADPHKAATVSQFQTAIAAAHAEVGDRAAFLQSWLDCEHGPAGVDGDHDGARWCDDCNDGNASVHPGAAEICGNKVDDNCNGLVDEGC
jgi:hypothetical protein